MPKDWESFCNMSCDTSQHVNRSWLESFCLGEFQIYIYGHKIIPHTYIFHISQQVFYHSKPSCNVKDNSSAVRFGVISYKRGQQIFGIHNWSKSSTSQCHYRQILVLGFQEFGKSTPNWPTNTKIRERTASHPTVCDPWHCLVDDTLPYKKAGYVSEWKPVMPPCLEETAIQ